MACARLALDVFTRQHSSRLGRRAAFPEIVGLGIAVVLSGGIWALLVAAARLLGWRRSWATAHIRARSPLTDR